MSYIFKNKNMHFYHIKFIFNMFSAIFAFVIEYYVFCF